MTVITEPEWLTSQRGRARDLLDDLEFPSFKGSLGWEFTDLGDFSFDRFESSRDGEGDASAVSRASTLLEVPGEGLTLAQVDGLRLERSGSEFPDGVVVLPLSEAVVEYPELVEPHLGRVVSSADDFFVARNEAEWQGGAFVFVPRGVRLESPIFLDAILDSADVSVSRRVLIVLDEDSQAEVWEQYLNTSSDSSTVLNTVVELVVGANSHLRYICSQDLNEKSYIFGSQRAEVDRSGTLEWVAIGFGSAKGKVRMETLLAGEGAHAKVTGAYAPHSRQHLDFDTTQEHGAPNTTSDLAFRGILADRSSAVWRGMIKVDPGAQKTDAFQECRNLLLSKRAHADAIPGLEILANDVRCTHAAAIAQIDPEQLFYLRSRGLDQANAARLVIEGFMSALVERFEAGPVREAIGSALEKRLEQILG